MIDVNLYRHSKEKNYFLLTAIFGGLVWVTCCWFLIPMALMMALPLWMAQQFFKASIFGNAALVGPKQYPQLHAMVISCGKSMGLAEVPHVFVVNGEGTLNALAIKFISGEYVILYSGLVDLMVEKRQTKELKMIIAHELAHHAAGHTSLWRNLLIMPAKYIPYVGMAYSRACEFTADRIGTAVAGDLDAGKRALLTLATGVKMLNTDLDAFVAQEKQISGFFGFINEVYSTHPRMTRRITELDKLAPMMPKRKTGTLTGSVKQVAAPSQEADYGHEQSYSEAYAAEQPADH